VNGAKSNSGANGLYGTFAQKGPNAEKVPRKSWGHSAITQWPSFSVEETLEGLNKPRAYTATRFASITIASQLALSMYEWTNERLEGRGPDIGGS
jgi:hypothetical protein